MSKVRISGPCRIPFACLILLSAFVLSPVAGQTTSDSLYHEALTAPAAHDSSGALELLDRALESRSDNYPARLARGNLRLERGERKGAEADFNRALGSSDRVVRSAAHLGLGNALSRLANGKQASIREYKLAAEVNPDNLEAWYKLAQAGFELGEATGYEIADNALTGLVCRDCTYRDAFELWRGKIKGHTHENRRKVCAALPEQISRNSALNHLWLAIAWDWFDLFETDSCLMALDSLEAKAPDYKPQERYLLRARCSLDQEDTSAFMQYYFQALTAAARSGDFSRLALETEVIFIPEEQENYARLSTAQGKASFFRVFWLNKDPDPVTFLNERLVEHYRRLRTVQRDYPMLTPDGLVNTSANYLRLMSRLPDNSAESGEEGSGGEVPEGDRFPYEYDPVETFGDKGDNLGLDHRGLLYVRHGPPDIVERVYIRDRRDGFVENMGKSGDIDIPNTDAWVFAADTFFFKSGSGTGGYLYYPKQTRGAGNINYAMQTQTWKDPMKVVEPEHYFAAFLGSSGFLELESYQSLPLEESKTESPPPSWLVLYDRSLLELASDSVQALKIGPEKDGYWLAVNKLPATAREYSFVLSLGLEDLRAVVKENLTVAPLSARSLSLSGVILGSPVPTGQAPHSRLGVPLLPRPSRKYSPEETITVYCELYGLRQAPDLGRSYREAVTVSLLEEKKSVLAAVLPGGRKRTGSLTMNFEREIGSTSPAVAETFEIDTSQLVPGRYSLKIEVRDKQGGETAETLSEFRVE